MSMMARVITKITSAGKLKVLKWAGAETRPAKVGI
jgi:hypothetical protein